MHVMLTANNDSSLLDSAGGDQIVIGLVNNMPDGALHNTERQFAGLLRAASRNVSTCLRYFSLPGVYRRAEVQAYISQCYEDISQLWSGRLDGLIVTGTEPHATLVQDEPCWPALRDLVHQVNEHAIPAIWSCLAAHAAVFDLDGVQRRPLRKKLSGVFECRKLADHDIVGNEAPRWWVPHSRQNELQEDELASKGYRILTRSPEVGADTFLREGTALFIFLQGHLEYDAQALFREYRRDVKRFLANERDDYPAMPSDYFGPETVSALVAFRERAVRRRRAETLRQFPGNPGKLTWRWRSPALSLYSNWLSHVQIQRRLRRPAA
jgi:homoserine O-succinyltransferase/O-acetyltransferase